MGLDAFYGTSYMTLTVGKGVTELKEVFYRTASEEIIVKTGNSTYFSDKGVLYRGTTLLQYPYDKKDGSYSIVDGTEIIGESSIAYNSYLKEVKIPDSIKTIESGAFTEDDGLNEVIIPYGVTSIGSHAFSYCEALERAEIPDSVIVIGNYAFDDCENLTIYCGVDSKAAEYAANNNIPFVTDTHCISFKIYKKYSAKSAQDQVRLEENAYNYTFTLYNNTQKKALAGYKVFLNDIVLSRDSVASGDEISIKVISKSDETVDANATVTLNDELSSNTEIEVLQKGYITVAPNTDKKASILIYDEAGILKQALESNGNTAVSNYLNNGTYKVVIIQGDKSLWKYNEISSFEKKGLQVNKDFITKEIKVIDGIITEWKDAIVPSIDVNLLRYLDTKASRYLVNTNETISGGLVSFRIDYAFNELRSDKVDNIQLTISIPTGCNYVTNSMFVDGKVAENVTEDASYIQLPLKEKSGVIRFNARPVQYGTLTTEARISFQDAGVSQIELIGTVDVQVPSITLDASSKTDKESIHVSGLTIPKEKVGIYDGSVRIGTATANASGKWDAEVSLNNPVNDSVHSIVAKVYVGTDKEIESNPVAVLYTAQAITVEQFIMYYNGGAKLDLKDILYKKKQVVSFNPSYPFTFTIALSDNEAVREVYVVSTKGNEKKKMEAAYDSKTDMWVAEGYFENDSSYVPGMLSIEYDESNRIIASDINVEMKPFEKNELPKELENSTGRIVENTYDSDTEEGQSIVDIPVDNGKDDHLIIATKSIKISEKERKEYSIEGLKKDGYLEVASPKNKERVFSKAVETDKGEVVLYSVTFKSDKNEWVSDQEDAVILSYGKEDSLASDIAFARDELTKKAINNGIVDIAGDVMGDGFGPVIDLLFEMKGVEDQTKQLNYAASLVRNSNLSDKEKQRRLLMLHNADCHRAVMFGLKLIPTVVGIGASILCPGAGTLFGLGSMVVGYILGNYATAVFNNSLDNALTCDLRWSIDPSGYAYEGVHSNRLEGVQTTIFYKGNNGEKVLWDASEYEQLNPIETNSEGVYAWDVPEGEWCVKFEKEGYETAFSEWVSVPPVQTEVNMGMISVNPPSICTCEVYDKYAVIEFDQYMKVSTVTKDTIHITDANKKSVQFTIKPIDAEDENSNLLSKQYKLEYSVPLNTASVTVTASKGILNYADKSLSKNYSFVKEMVSAIEGLDVDIPETVNCGELISIPILIAPQGNYQGYTITCESSSSDIAEIRTVSKPDAQGQVNVVLDAKLPGVVRLNIALEGTHIVRNVDIAIGKNDAEAVKNIVDAEIIGITDKTYTGSPLTQALKVVFDSRELVLGDDYKLVYENNTNAGKAIVKVTGTGDYKGEKSVTFTINKADAKLAFADSALTKKTTDVAFTNTLTKTTDGSVIFKSSNTNVATVNSASGLVTIKGAGTVTITATASEGKNYKSGSATYSLNVEKPAPTPTPKPTVSGFSDVQNPNHAYYKAIYWAADAGITKGYSDGTFGINRSCTRGEMMMFLWRYAGKPAPKAVSKSPFKDVPKSHVFYNAILWGSQKGITKGYPDGTFGINRNVSRGECMMFLWRLKGKSAPKAVAKSPFKDVPKNHAFYNAILWGAQKKITTGYTSGVKKGTFGINENCTRGQIVTFLYRAK